MWQQNIRQYCLCVIFISTTLKTHFNDNNTNNKYSNKKYNNNKCPVEACTMNNNKCWDYMVLNLIFSMCWMLVYMRQQQLKWNNHCLVSLQRGNSPKEVTWAVPPATLARSCAEKVIYVIVYTQSDMSTSLLTSTIAEV